jgi:ABC-type multidrug transport system fused ATPase/permease subunit
MIDTLKKLRELLTVRERRRFYLLFGMMMLSALVEVVTISVMFPFLAVVARPSVVDTNPTLAAIYQGLGFQSHESFLIFAGAGVFAIVVGGLIFATVTNYAIYHFAAMRTVTIGRRLLRGYLRQPYSWFLNQHSAGIGASILTEVQEVILRCMLPALKAISQATVAVFIIVLLVAAQPVAALTAAGLIGAVYAITYFLARQKLARMGRDRKAANQEKYKITGEAIGGIKDVKLMGLEEVFIRRYNDPAIRAARASAGVSVAGEVPRNVLRAVTLGGIILFVVIMLVRGRTDLSGLLPILGLYAFAGLRLLPALQQIYMAMTHMRFGKPALDKLHADILTHLSPVEADAEAAEAEAEGSGGAAPAAAPVAPVRLRERLELRGVRYAYPGAERPALDGFDLVIPARTTVGLVGGTGAGKTTAVDLILGLLRPQAGAVVVDGVPVADDAVRGWQKSIGYVPQHIFLTDDTVSANIAFGIDAAKIDQERVERAARIAELHDFVERELPKGYRTLLGERGVRLSGGQRQRIGIARALYHDPDVLVLDEATSALDNLTEQVVMEAVHNLGRQKTIIMIAHRLSTVRDCDVIFMLERGQVTAQGAYDELVETSDEFRRLATIGQG